MTTPRLSVRAAARTVRDRYQRACRHDDRMLQIRRWVEELYTIEQDPLLTQLMARRAAVLRALLAEHV
ncbi:MAG TPA: hypothetical protein VE127_15920 [Solirubrobacteraceae bacterium]|nr:hypothetical protein [Solirubrobacteraceae bacterium]